MRIDTVTVRYLHDWELHIEEPSRTPDETVITIRKKGVGGGSNFDTRAVERLGAEHQLMRQAIHHVPDEKLSYWAEENFKYKVWEWDDLSDLLPTGGK